MRQRRQLPLIHFPTSITSARYLLYSTYIHACIYCHVPFIISADTNCVCVCVRACVHALYVNVCVCVCVCVSVECKCEVWIMASMASYIYNYSS